MKSSTGNQFRTSCHNSVDKDNNMEQFFSDCDVQGDNKADVGRYGLFVMCGKYDTPDDCIDNASQYDLMKIEAIAWA